MITDTIVYARMAATELTSMSAVVKASACAPVPNSAARNASRTNPSTRDSRVNAVTTSAARAIAPRFTRE